MLHSDGMNPVKRILVPVDFKVESLITLKKALDVLEDTMVEATLLYAEHLNDNISELLFYSPKDKMEKMVPRVFHEALSIIRNRYENNLGGVFIEFFHGYGVGAMKNFIDANRIDMAFLPSGYRLKPMRNGFDPLPIIRRTGIPIQEVALMNGNPFTDSQHLSLLFNH